LLLKKRKSGVVVYRFELSVCLLPKITIEGLGNDWNGKVDNILQFYRSGVHFMHSARGKSITSERDYEQHWNEICVDSRWKVYDGITGSGASFSE
jgi:hypothetical protein